MTMSVGWWVGGRCNFQQSATTPLGLTDQQQHSKLPSSFTIEAFLLLLLQSKLPSSSSSIIDNYATSSGSFALFFHKDDMKHNLHYNNVVVGIQKFRNLKNQVGTKP
jgi:hypothetical protein